MKLLFCGTPSHALLRDLRVIGHEVIAPREADWWCAMRDHRTPDQYGDDLWRLCLAHKPDALVLHKGWHAWEDAPAWVVPHRVLWGLRRHVPALVLMCFDDPAATPVTLEYGVAAPADLWLTSCVGIADDPGPLAVNRTIGARVEEYWLAHDHLVEPEHDADLEGIDVCLTGSPYYRPFPPPHYQGGFTTPRREFALRAIERGMRPGIWGPNTWMDPDRGGHPPLGAWHRGWIDHSQVHRVHASVNAVVATHLVEGRRYDSGRIPDILGAGGCLVHELRPGLDDECGSAVAFFCQHDVDGALNLCAELRADQPRRARMIAEGRALVLGRHTWMHRAARLAELVGEVRRF